MRVTHSYTDPIADDPADALAGRVLPSHWNADHVIEAGPTTAYEAVFAGMTTQSFTDGVNATLDGIVYTPSIPGGGSLSITANGLRVQQGSSAENFLWVLPANQPGGRSILHNKLGADVLRARRWGVWTRLHSYNLYTDGNWFYATILGTAYPNNYYGVRRGRGVSSTPSTSTGGLIAWSARAGSDSAQVLSARSDSDLTSDAYHSTGELVTLMMFHDPWMIDYYFGNWTDGDWPSMEDMTHGGSFNSRPTMPSGEHFKQRDPRVWNFGFGGGQGYSTNTEFTVDRYRLTYW